MKEIEYGTKEYYKRQLKANECKFELMTKGFSAIVEQNKYMTWEQVAEYVEQLHYVVGDLEYSEDKLREFEKEEDDDER